MPYTELEHRTATDLGISTLVFVLTDDAQGPAAIFRDTEYGARRDAVWARLADSGATTTPTTTPGVWVPRIRSPSLCLSNWI